MPAHLQALRRYRSLPGLLGWSYLAIGFLGRLPTSMVILGVLTLVATSTGSVGAAGTASAALALATAVSGPLIGRWTDRRGQRLPLLLLAPVNAVALVALALAAGDRAPLPVLCGLCALVGATTVPVGSLTRVRWLARTTGAEQGAAALSYESMVDEMVFVIGPALVGVAASAASPQVPVLGAAALVLVFVTALAVHPSGAGLGAAPARAPRRAGSAAGRPLPGARATPGLAAVLRAVGVAVAGMSCVGLFFGATQTGVTAFATEAGEPGSAGLVYALMGVGSAVMSLAVVALPASVSLRLRLGASGAGIAGVTAAMTAASSLTVLAVLMLAVGFLVGPALVTLFTLGGRLAPVGATAVAMTVLASANVVGVAGGAALAGRLSDAHGADAAFVVAALSCVVLALVAGAARMPGRSADPH
ncbi:MFS transporter [Georgenia sp. SYP-B2076]|uniref:MFS transporter n=1 Tax=Georgenia sp. SYP-B2076 TaxID=2495881 RepID=UPI000F8EFC7F|nr:MFS transporter [Georgenia sp. SYP-B2076]